jgi:tagatose 1,6-diphosphate aldolase
MTLKMNVTPGKVSGLRAISNTRGVIAALALDQRGILKQAIAREMGAGNIPDSAVVEFKEIATEVLTKHASAILLDPEYGFPAARHRHTAGLLLSYERSSYEAAPPRMPLLYETWSVRRLAEAGANGIKILLYYTPFENAAINQQKQAWVERIGDECRANDIPFVLELVGYDAHGGEKTLAYAKRKPEIVAQSMTEFSKDCYGVDLLKVEVPVLMKFVAETRFFQGEAAYTQAEAQLYFRATDAATGKPFVYLSAGVSNAEFIEALEFAIESGSRFSGVLCGRATWQDGIPVYAKQGAKALEDWLNTTGIENITRLNDVLTAAQPWYERLGMSAPAVNQSAG